MAVCPECGGRVLPGLVPSLRPAATFPCRWCNAVLSWSPAWRMLRDTLFVAGLAAAVAVPYWLARRGTLSFWLEVSLAALAAVVFLAWLLGDVLPLRTIRPRNVFPAGERRASGRRDRP